MNCREAGLQGSAVHSQRDKATNGPRSMASIKGQGPSEVFGSQRMSRHLKGSASWPQEAAIYRTVFNSFHAKQQVMGEH